MGFIMIGIGGFIGSCCRYLLTKLLVHITPAFPFGTLVSNVAAALLIGFITGIERQSSLPANTKLFLTTGLLGGLSTFSTFSMETVCYLENSKFILAAGNILLNAGLSLICVLIGLSLAKVVARA